MLIKAGNLHHNGNPVLRWMAGNAQAKYDDAFNIKLVKNKSADKIDGVIALIMAIAEKMSNERRRPELLRRTRQGCCKKRPFRRGLSYVKSVPFRPFTIVLFIDSYNF